jgi:PBP1b-binding outer membrane lipoprotein LpoB
MKKLVAVMVIAAFLSGCATFDPAGRQSAGPGQAVYHYKRTGDSCEVIITSAREVPGIEASVDKNCAVTVKAEALSGAGIMGALLERLQLLIKELK